MAEKQEKTYVGSVKAKTITTAYGDMEILKISFSKSDIEKLSENLNERGWVNLDMVKRKQVSDKGQTHSITIDTWKPDAKGKLPVSHKEAVRDTPTGTTDRNGIVTPDDTELPFVLFIP